MDSRHVATAAIAAFNRHDVAAIGAIYAEDATQADPQYPDLLRGRAAIAADFQQLFTAFPDIAIELVSVVADGNAVAYEVIMHGTHTGPLQSPQGAVPATDRRIEMRACHFMQLDERGLVRTDRRYYDLASLLGQLGLLDA